MSALRKQLEADLPLAMKARAASRAGVLRTTLAAIANAEAVDVDGEHQRAGLYGDVERKLLTDDDVRAVVEHERDDLRGLAQHMYDIGQRDEGDDLTERADVLERYLS